MELSRIKTLYCGLIFQLLFTLALPLPYTKYGRTCSDIGCLSSQVCVMAYESCSLGQREGNECGRYPTCKKNTDPSLSAGPSEGVSNVYNNGPRPSAPAGRPGNGGADDDDVLGTLGLNPNNPYGQRPTPPPARPPASGPSLYPSLPTDNNPGNRYGGNNGGGGYNGGGAGDSYNRGGGGGNSAHGGGGHFDGAGGNIVVPTRKPAEPSGGFFGGILNGVQNAVSNAVKQQIGTYINQRLGIGPAAGGAAGAGGGGGAGGLGGLFDARNLIDNKRFGGLFSENKPAGSAGTGTAGTSSGGTSIGPGGYPVTVDQRMSASNYNQQYAPAQPGQAAYPQSYGNYNTANTARARSTERPAYGWNLN
uniref:Uncharacterized protein n=1 Tax=Anopheles funestus TaxID=62324 RepID=A0A182RJN5_ANOFN